jgi:hypothetical protein
MADHADDGGDDDVFLYMGGGIPHHLKDTITHVRIDESISFVRLDAFQFCRNLVSVELHDGVDLIEEFAFNDCTSLREINLPGVRVIDHLAFSDCTALTDVFGDKLETIGHNCFLRCTSLRNINLLKVRVLEFSAFSDCEQLTDVELSEDLESIEGNSFGNCRRLRRIAFPLKENLLENDNVFRGCDSLSTVALVGTIHKTIASLLLDSWRNEMSDEIDSINQDLPNTPTNEKTALIRGWMGRVLDRIEHYKLEHHELLKEAMVLLELALWKAKLDDNVVDDAAAQEGVRVTRRQRKRARKDRSITSGASIVIKNVLPFLKLE